MQLFSMDAVTLAGSLAGTLAVVSASLHQQGFSLSFPASGRGRQQVIPGISPSDSAEMEETNVSMAKRAWYWSVTGHYQPVFKRDEQETEPSETWNVVTVVRALT